MYIFSHGILSCIVVLIALLAGVGGETPPLTQRGQHCLLGRSTSQSFLAERQTCKRPPLGPVCGELWSSCGWRGAQGMAPDDMKWGLQLYCIASKAWREPSLSGRTLTNH